MATVIRRQDVDALAGKLEEFASHLPEHERDVLGWVLARARAADLELSDSDLEAAAGGSTSGSFHQTLERAAGLGGVKPQADSVKWTHTFAD